MDDLATAEDIVQDVFVRLHRRGDAPLESLDWYLTTAVLNTARSALRRRRVAAGGLLSERDTARTLGVSAGTVKTSTSRAMKALAHELGDTDE